MAQVVPFRPTLGWGQQPQNQNHSQGWGERRHRQAMTGRGGSGDRGLRETIPSFKKMKHRPVYGPLLGRWKEG